MQKLALLVPKKGMKYDCVEEIVWIPTHLRFYMRDLPNKNYDTFVTTIAVGLERFTLHHHHQLGYRNLANNHRVVGTTVGLRTCSISTTIYSRLFIHSDIYGVINS